MKSVFGRLWTKLPLLLLLSFFGVASIKAYIKIQTTVIGYRIGQKKQNEAELLEKQSYLKMELAKLTTKQNLIEMTQRNDNNPAKQVWASH